MSMNGFVSRMARREMRGSFRHFALYLFCIALGVGSLVGVGNVTLNLDQMVRRDARNLLAADLEIRLNRPLGDDGIKVLQKLSSEGVAWIRATELTAMATNPKNASSQLIELKAVEAGYPFYGKLAINPPLSETAWKNSAGVFAQESLLLKLHLKPGDPIKIGRAVFTIRGVLLKEPDRVAGTFSLGPRLLMAQEGLTATGLIQPGSRVRYRYLLKAPPSVLSEAIKQRLEKEPALESADIRTYQDAQPALVNFLKRLGTYLGMVGLITLIIGGIGVANGIRVFLKEKLDTIAILKALGGQGRMIFRIYLTQALILGILGSLLGVLVGTVISESLGLFLKSVMGSDFNFNFQFSPALRGAGMGILTTLLFTIWPLMETLTVSPLRLFRREIEDRGKNRLGLLSWLVLGTIIIALGILAVWQAESFKLGMVFIGTVAIAFILLRLGSWAILRLIKGLPRFRSFVFRQGLVNLTRPGNQTHMTVFSIGLGVTIILTVSLVQTSLLRQIQDNLPTDAPSLFFIDIQSDQKQAFEKVVSRVDPSIALKMTPIVRSRLYSVNAKVVADIKDDQPNAWYFTREYVLTFQKELPENNIIQKGRWWTDGDRNGHALISIEEEAARALGVDLGSTIVFDILGTRIPATVASIRKVDWGSMTTNFYIIFSPGALDGMPMTYVATARTPRGEEPKLQDATVTSFPNVTAINLRDVLETVGGILNRMSQVIRFVAAFSILAGLIVLSGALAATRLQRIREAVILKTVGATRSFLVQTFAVEYALLGTVAGIIGAGLSTLLAWGIVHYILESPWYFSPIAVTIGILTTIILTVLTGFLATYRILGQKPLVVLRTE